MDVLTVMRKNQMNERIESYLKLHYCRDYFNTYGETVDDDHYFMYREDIDGLIELIVSECASICYNSKLEDGDLHAQNLLYEFNIDDRS